MTLGNILILAIIVGIGCQFWRLRGISETIITLVKQYCVKENLQFLALARISTRLGSHKGKLDWRLTYQLHFSSDGENEYIGIVETIGKRIIRIDLPVFRVNAQH
ncbi:MAG: DUF3301 domain-containing protein [Pseudomonadota bacterium]